MKDTTSHNPSNCLMTLYLTNKAGSTPLYGYAWVDVTNGSKQTHDAYTIDQEVVGTVRWIFEQVLSGSTIRGIAGQLNEQGLLTPAYYFDSKGLLGRVQNGRCAWTHRMVRRIITNPAYMGKHRVHSMVHTETIRTDEITGKSKTVMTQSRRPVEETILLPDSTCPAIIDEISWQRAQEILSHNKISGSRRMRHREAALLSRGHVFCGHCLRPASTNYRQEKFTHAVSYRYGCMYTHNKVYSDELRCSHGFTLKTPDIDEYVWRYVVYYIREKMGSQRSLIQEMIEKKSNEGQEQQVYNLSSLKATEQLLQQCYAEQQNLERALQAALKQEYNEKHIDRLQRMLNDNDQEIARLKQVQIESAKRIDKKNRKMAGIQVAVNKLPELRRNIDTASWAEKRHLLYLLGVKVFIYHTGTITDERGNRWKVKFGWEGLEDIINTASSGGLVNYFP